MEGHPEMDQLHLSSHLSPKILLFWPINPDVTHLRPDTQNKPPPPSLLSDRKRERKTLGEDQMLKELAPAQAFKDSPRL